MEGLSTRSPLSVVFGLSTTIRPGRSLGLLYCYVSIPFWLVEGLSTRSPLSVVLGLSTTIRPFKVTR